MFTNRYRRKKKNNSFVPQQRFASDSISVIGMAVTSDGNLQTNRDRAIRVVSTNKSTFLSATFFIPHRKKSFVQESRSDSTRRFAITMGSRACISAWTSLFQIHELQITRLECTFSYRIILFCFTLRLRLPVRNFLHTLRP